MKIDLTEWYFSVNAKDCDFIKGVKGDKVSVPHTWNVYDSTQYYVGKGYYSCEFALDNVYEHIRLDCQGIFLNSFVYVNGEYVGSHIGAGFCPFWLDITAYARQGKNMLVIVVDNTFDKKALPYANKFDWANDGGIIRPVSILCFGKGEIRNIGISTYIDEYIGEDRCNGRISLDIEIYESIECASACTMANKTSLIKHTQKSVGDKTSEQSCNKGAMLSLAYKGETVHNQDIILKDGKQIIELKNMLCWSPKNPHLYELCIEYGDYKFVKNIGIRQLIIKGNKIFLNGKPTRLIGIEYMPGSNVRYGMAEPMSELIKNLQYLKEAGCNFTRFHWQQRDEVFDWCDKNGILVQEEIPYWGGPNSAGKRQLEIAKRQADDMIYAHKSHPSIISIAVGNELGGYSLRTKRYVKRMYAYIKALDDTKLVNYVSNTLAKRPIAEHLGIREATSLGDICMWNEYLGTWRPCKDFDKVLADAKYATHGKPFMVTEFGLCEPAFSGGDERRIQEYKTKVALYKKYDIQGWVYFCLNDYRTHMGEDGKGKYRQRIHGSITLDGKLKPSYEFLKKTITADLQDSQAKAIIDKNQQ